MPTPSDYGFEAMYDDFNLKYKNDTDVLDYVIDHKQRVEDFYDFEKKRWKTDDDVDVHKNDDDDERHREEIPPLTPAGVSGYDDVEPDTHQAAHGDVHNHHKTTSAPISPKRETDIDE